MQHTSGLVGSAYLSLFLNQVAQFLFGHQRPTGSHLVASLPFFSSLLCQPYQPSGHSNPCTANLACGSQYHGDLCDREDGETLNSTPCTFYGRNTGFRISWIRNRHVDDASDIATYCRYLGYRLRTWHAWVGSVTSV